MTEQSPREDSARSLLSLLKLIRRLRAPNGCPWDRKQTLDDCRAYLIEEAHEVAAAIDARNWEELEAELGDLLFQLCFIAELAGELELFDLDAVAERTHDKMVARHPHVFGEHSLDSAAEVEHAWQRRKLEQERLTGKPAPSLLAGVASSLPALTASYRLSQKAAGVGFDWHATSDIFAKVAEELGELEEAVEAGERGDDHTEEELGDLLFTAACLGRSVGVDPERALARANLKFRRRFAQVEQGLGAELVRGSEDHAVREKMERLWQQAKALENE